MSDLMLFPLKRCSHCRRLAIYKWDRYMITTTCSFGGAIERRRVCRKHYKEFNEKNKPQGAS